MTCKYCLLFELGHCRKTNPYPKDKDLIFKKRIDNNIYIYISQPEFDMSVHNHNYQKNEISNYEQMSLFEDDTD